MKIKSIQYPEGCQLKGWNKMVFERRVKETFGSFFSVCELDRCRAEILGAEPDKEQRDELNVFHCESFKKMSLAETQALVDKTAKYIGIGVTVKYPSRVGAVLAAIIGGVLAGALGVQVIHAAGVKKGLSETNYVTPRVGREMPIQPAAIPMDSPLEPMEPIFTTTVRTRQPAVTAKALARTVRSDVGEYEVSLIVTPIKAKDE